MLPLMEIGAGDGMGEGDGVMRIVLNISLSSPSPILPFLLSSLDNIQEKHVPIK
jgi:hypothetical protein